MQIFFKEVDQENWRKCTNLRVSKEQEDFVAPNWYSILEAKFEEDCYPLCIYDEEVMVGFVMYAFESDIQRMEMCRLMIDQKYQGKGYGKIAVLKLLDLVREKYGNISFYTSIVPTNIVAQKLYESVGFKKTGEILYDEEVMVIQL